ncbi:MAG TPA: recombination mediator RecR [Candidatus Dormibacteraeota bacterium]|jgi:recombination protein RecR
MDFLPPALSALIEELGRLPGMGPKSANRLAFHLLRTQQGAVERLSKALAGLHDGVGFCQTCAFISAGPICPICQDTRRDDSVICVVEEPTDVIAIERTGEFRGRYHVLLGAISPMDGVGPGEIRVEELLSRLRASATREVILATDGDIEGEATAAYLAQVIDALGTGIGVTRLARGLPMGGELEYADELTIARALSGRRPI